MIAVLGAGGSIANELVRKLAARGERYRLVSRSAKSDPGATEVVKADLLDREQTAAAVAGTHTVLLLAGLRYDHNVWAEQWPRIMENAIEACKRAGARLLFFDNVYMYGRVHGAMTEETPYRPVSRKGEVRAQIARRLEDEWKAGALQALIARSADFYGPGVKTGIPNVMVFGALKKGQRPMCLISEVLPHSYTYVPDAAEAVARLAATETAQEPVWNQTWHLPTRAPALTGREFIERASEAMGRAKKTQVLSRPMVRVVGWFNPLVREIYEMLYQNDAPYLFDSSKYERAFGVEPTPYADGIRATAEFYHKGA